MKSLFSILLALVAVVVFAAMAVADPGNTWGKQINSPRRFKVLKQFGNAAVLDQETGRVWEQSPSTNTFNWFDALAHCYPLEVGGRKGWRLPTIEELASLVDTSQPAPMLPAGHPFTNVFSGDVTRRYWSATSRSNTPWNVSFFDGDVDTPSTTGGLYYAWCVRGGQGIDGVQ